MKVLRISDYMRENPLGAIGFSLACLALISLGLPIRLSTAVIVGTTILVATFASLIFCLVSLIREKSELPGFLGILAILLGETYKLPIILLNAFTLLVMYLPYLLLLVLGAVIAGYVYRHVRRT